MEGPPSFPSGSPSYAPHSPEDQKPDMALLLPPPPQGYQPYQSYSSLPSPSSYSPTSSLPTPTPPPYYPSGPSPLPHPLSGAKHMCAICGDRATGKHYGVYSCEGCKGFFKRTVRKELEGTYACKEVQQCEVDKKKRNRCQYCRYQKCLQVGMKRAAVQEERQRGGRGGGEEGEGGVEAGLGPQDMPAARILAAEAACAVPATAAAGEGTDLLKFAADRQLASLVQWAKLVPHFSQLPPDDQVLLLRGGWNELMIAGFAHKSLGCPSGIELAGGVLVTRESAYLAGMGAIADRVLDELMERMRTIDMDKTELGCLRAIVLFNPGVKGLQEVARVERLRENVYTTLEEHARMTRPQEPNRFARLLLRLPALRSIGLKVKEQLLFLKTVGGGEGDVASLLTDLLEADRLE